jgi:hypothetical protein
MNGPKGLLIVCLLGGLFQSTDTFAQEKKRAAEGPTAEAATELFGGNADRWLNALIASRETLDTSIYLDRLSYFHLTEPQIRQLRTAAEEEQSDRKRVVLWHALRQSRDVRSRDYLIKTLVGDSVDMQIQFINELRNPSRFDIPILVALYNSHRPKKKDLLQQQYSNDIGKRDPLAEIDDVLDVPDKIAELTNHANWGALTVMTGWTYPGEKTPLEKKWLESTGKKGTEAELTHEDMVYWLIKNGFKDRHRINAFRAFITEGTFWQRTKGYSNMGKELLKGLDNPDSKALAVPLIRRWVDPSNFLLANEAEVVKLTAMATMEEDVLGSFDAQKPIGILDKIPVYLPILEQVLNSDPSPKVREAAKELKEKIEALERENARPVRKAK